MLLSLLVPATVGTCRGEGRQGKQGRKEELGGFPWGFVFAHARGSYR